MTPTIGVNLRVTGNCSQGGRKYMEDMFSVAYQQTNDNLDLEYAFFGMFDGHGGHEAATFAKKHLMKNIVTQSGFWSNDDEDICRAIKEGFLATHYAMWRNLENWPKTQSGLPSTSGTTASVAFIRRAKLYVGHVGDSGIVLGQRHADEEKWTARLLTTDHKPETPAELARIRAAGGQVTVKAGVPRVVWQRPSSSHQGPLTRSTHIDQIPFLAVARSLGDLWSYNADSDQFVVSPEPDVSVHALDQEVDRCLILGTDGLFNMLSPQEAVDIVQEAEDNNKIRHDKKYSPNAVWLNPSKYLVDHAISKWSESRLRADNTSAVVLLLDPLGPPRKIPRSNGSSQPYTIESYRVKEGKSSNRSDSNGLAICTWMPPVPNEKKEPLSPNAPSNTLRGMTQLFGDNPLPSSSKSHASTVDNVPNLLQAISLEDVPEPTDSSTSPTTSPRHRSRKLGKRGRKRRNLKPKTASRRESSLSDHEVASVPEPIRTRRTRSEEPVRTEMRTEARCESDAENVDAPMRLRSTTPFKTLRSRNINLENCNPAFPLVDEPRTKRLKK